MYLQLYCQFYLLLSKEISPVFARLCFSQLLNHDAESVPARLEVLRIISSVKHSQITQQQSSKAFIGGHIATSVHHLIVVECLKGTGVALSIVDAKC